MDESSRSKRGEAKEFWATAIRLWTDSRFSVRVFCGREGLTKHGFIHGGLGVFGELFQAGHGREF